MIKFYDTSALLQLQDKAFDYDNPFVIPSITLEELENIKTSAHKDNELKCAARSVTHLLATLQDYYEVIPYKKYYSWKLAMCGYKITNDMKILSCAMKCKDCNFITADLSFYLIAKSFISTSTLLREYLNQKPEYTGYRTLILSDEEIAELYIPNSENKYHLLINEYIIIKNFEDEIVDLLCWDGTGYRHVDDSPINSKFFGKVQALKGDVYQKFALDSLRTHQLTVLRGSAGSGKAQPNSTLIPTKQGYKKLGDIVPGDYVLDRFGNETKVLATFPQGLKENYKITFSDGRESYCNDEHIWTCYTSKGHFKNFTVQEMFQLGLRAPGGQYRFKIPITEAVEFEEKQFDIDPYVIGAFLGDGCCKEKPLTFSSNDEEIVTEITSLIGAKGYRRNSQSNYNWEFLLPDEQQYNNTNNFHALVIRYQTRQFFKKYQNELIQPAHLKRIPEIYKYGSIEQRFSLIQGLMDTDGTIDNKEKGRTRFTSISLGLVQDLQEICWSLGFSASISEDRREGKYPITGCAYNLTLSCPKEIKPKLFRLKRKKDIAIAYSNNGKHSIHSDKLTIKKIEKMPHLEEMTCLLVDNDEHLYLTEQYIVTHNTFLGLTYLYSLLEKGEITRLYIFANPVATRNAAQLGYYSGSRTEKLMDSQTGNFLISKFGDPAIVENLIDKGRIMLLPFADIRGISVPSGCAMYITEAQNTDINLMKLALQRVEDNVKVVIEGDYETQVDIRSYEGKNNGLRRLSEIFRGKDCYSEVKLQNNYRSVISDTAEDM